MVNTFGNSIVSAFTNGSSVNAIYTYGEKVWPDGSTPSGSYYIKWWPKSASGVFIIGGQARYLEDYNGYYSGPFLSSGSFEAIIDPDAFMSTSILGVETNVTYVGSTAFRSCPNLRYVSMPDVTRVDKACVFADCPMLYEIELPKVKFIEWETFANCSYLHYVSLPEVEWIGTSTPAPVAAFSNCWSLIDVYLPNCKVIGEYAMAWCGLSSIDLPSIIRIGSGGFYSCSNLQTIVLAGSSIPTLYESAFTGTKMNTSSARVYVPISMLLDYKAAWSGWSSIIYPISNS